MPSCISSPSISECVWCVVVGNKSGLYGYMKMLIEKGKESNDSNVKLMNEEDETIADE